MIVTLTANPSIDRTVTLPGPLCRGDVHRAEAATEDPGGKGVNVARVLRSAGAAVLALLPGNPGDPLPAALAELGVPYRLVGPTGRARTNLTITEPDGTTTKLNAPGAPLTTALRNELAVALRTSAETASWVVLSGSLPPGVPDGWYAELVGQLRALPVRIAVDTSDAPLLALAAEFPSSAPDLLKPNATELAQLTGVDSESLEIAATHGDPLPAAGASAILVDRGVAAVLTTLGGAGAVLVTTAGAWHATTAKVIARSTVGAGDSALAGYLLAQLDRAAPAESLRRAVAYGTAAVTLPGTALPTPTQLDTNSVTVTELDSRTATAVTGP